MLRRDVNVDDLLDGRRRLVDRDRDGNQLGIGRSRRGLDDLRAMNGLGIVEDLRAVIDLDGVLRSRQGVDERLLAPRAPDLDSLGNRLRGAAKPSTVGAEDS